MNFNSRHTRGQWWSVAHHEPFWEAQFTRQTPIEVVAAVTQSLPQLIGDHRHSGQNPLTHLPGRNRDTCRDTLIHIFLPSRCVPPPPHALRTRPVRPRQRRPTQSRVGAPPGMPPTETLGPPCLLWTSPMCSSGPPTTDTPSSSSTGVSATPTGC
ncbi:DUF317 domain-containing protein [Streptomyces sp. NPDC054841]